MTRTERPALPADFGLVLDPATRRLDGGTVLVGGTPFRVLRLTPAGGRALDELAGGAPVGPGPARRRLARRLLDAGLAHPRPGMSAWTPADVTAVLPARATAAELARTLAALGPVGATVIVDDASPLPLTAPAGARLIRHGRPRGPGAARNAGWRAARTPLIAFVDTDCQPAPGWLKTLLPHFADPAVGAVAPRIVARAGDAPRWLAAYEATRSPLDRGGRPGLVRPGGPVPYVPSAALLVRAEALAAAGGFDERLRFGEDVDLVWRLVETGWTLRYEPAATVSHPTRATPPAWVRQRFDYGSSAAPLAARHGDAVTPLRVSVWSAAAWTLAGLGRPLAGATVAAGTTALLAPRLSRLEHPLTEAARLAGRGSLAAGAALAEAVRRSWWPLALVVAFGWRRARPGVAAAFCLPPLAEAMAQSAVDPLGWAAVRIADDVAYGAGVWAGCLRARSAAALRPDLRNWPGRRPAVEDQTPTTETNDTISPG